MDIISLGVGILIGFFSVIFAIELGVKKILPYTESVRITTQWALSDLGSSPLYIVCEKISDIDLPKNVAIISKERFPEYEKFNSKIIPTVNTNFAVSEDRALIFSTSIKPNIFAVWTSNAKIISRLIAEFNRLWYSK